LYGRYGFPCNRKMAVTTLAGPDEGPILEGRRA
jgi:hypothetical protein